MVKYYKILILVLIAIVLSNGIIGAEQLDATLPVPPEGWWKSLKGGETAIFDMTANSREMKMVITVEKVNGSNITFSTHTSYQDGGALPKEVTTIDAASDPRVMGGRLQPGATARKVKDTVFEAGGQSYNCTIFLINVKGLEMEMWNTTQLPPIFNGGNVRTVIGTEKMAIITNLISYNGPRL